MVVLTIFVWFCHILSAGLYKVKKVFFFKRPSCLCFSYKKQRIDVFKGIEWLFWYKRCVKNIKQFCC